MTTFIIAKDDRAARLALSTRPHLPPLHSDSVALIQSATDLVGRDISARDHLIIVPHGDAARSYEALVRHGREHGVDVTELFKATLQ